MGEQWRETFEKEKRNSRTPTSAEISKGFFSYIFFDPLRYFSMVIFPSADDINIHKLAWMGFCTWTTATKTFGIIDICSPFSLQPLLQVHTCQVMFRRWLMHNFRARNLIWSFSKFILYLQFWVRKSWKIVKISSCAQTHSHSMWKFIFTIIANITRGKRKFQWIYFFLYFPNGTECVLVKWKQEEEVCKPAPDVIIRRWKKQRCQICMKFYRKFQEKAHEGLEQVLNN